MRPTPPMFFRHYHGLKRTLNVSLQLDAKYIYIHNVLFWLALAHYGESTVDKTLQFLPLLMEWRAVFITSGCRRGGQSADV